MSRFMWQITNTSIDPPQVGRHVDVQHGTTWQPLIPQRPEGGRLGEPGITIDLGGTGRIGVEAWRAFK